MSTASRSRSRSPHAPSVSESINGDQSPERDTKLEPDTESLPDQTTKPEKIYHYQALKLSNFPKIWNHFNIRDFVKENIPDPETYKSVNSSLQFIKMLKDKADHNKFGRCLLIFSCYEDAKAALDALARATHEGQSIRVLPDYDYKYIKGPKAEAVKPFPKPIIRHDWSKFETYGLSGSYLDSLRIKPPLQSKIFIKSLDARVTESKLREVFGHAGHVLCVTVIQRSLSDSSWLMAKIEFDHPVEAVQAISMFHNQDLYDRRMEIQLDSRKTDPKRQMPEGLKQFGPGLGAQGEAIRGIRNAVELQPFKKFVTQEIEKLKTFLETLLERKENKTRNDQPQDNSLSPLMALNSILNPQSLQTLQSLQALLGQAGNTEPTASTANPRLQTPNPGQQTPNPVFQAPTFQASGFQPSGFQSSGFQPSGFQNSPGYQNNIQSPGMAYPTQIASQNVPGYWPTPTETPKPVPPVANQGAWMDTSDPSYYVGNYQQNDNSMNRAYKEAESTSKLSSGDMLMFSNLPASVTSQALVVKMREVGELKFAEITGQGRAIVRFVHIEDALRCVKLFDQSKVDGQMIGVKLL